MRGALIFTLICTGCLGFVIFFTGKQSLSGLRRVVRCAEPAAVPAVGRPLLLTRAQPLAQPQPQPQPQPRTYPQP